MRKPRGVAVAVVAAAVAAAVAVAAAALSNESVENRGNIAVATLGKKGKTRARESSSSNNTLERLAARFANRRWRFHCHTPRAYRGREREPVVAYFIP